MMMLKLTARVIGLHQLTLLDFYPSEIYPGILIDKIGEIRYSA